jgi:hypothetical protein
MHVGCSDRLDLYERFRKEVGSQLLATQVVAPTRIGDALRYQAGRMRSEE